MEYDCYNQETKIRVFNPRKMIKRCLANRELIVGNGVLVVAIGSIYTNAFYLRQCIYPKCLPCVL